jgi:hypothetical protein
MSNPTPARQWTVRHSAKSGEVRIKPPWSNTWYCVEPAEARHLAATIAAEADALSLEQLGIYPDKEARP